MIKKIRKSLILYFVALFCIFTNVFISHANNAYNVVSYNSNVTVKSNNVYVIENVITIRPYSETLEIVYEIPTVVNGNQIKISDIIVKNAEYDRVINKKNNVITLKDNNSNITKTYVIAYTLNYGEDYKKENDYIDVEIVPNNIKSNISKLNISLVMPTDYEIGNLNFATCTLDGNIIENTIQTKFKYTYNKESNVLNASYNDFLKYGESMKLKMELPEGYFTGEDNKNFKTGILIFISIVFFASMLVLFFITGRDEEILNNQSSNFPEFLAPSSINLFAEILIEKKEITRENKRIFNNLISMLIYWANKGYISIKENCVSDINGDKNMIITKLWNVNEDDETPIYEKILFNAFFEIGDGKVVDFKKVRLQISNGTFDKTKRDKINEYLNTFYKQETEYIYNLIDEGENSKINLRLKFLRFAPIVLFNIVGFITAIIDFVVLSDIYYPILYLVFSSILLILSGKNMKDQYIYNIGYMIVNGILALGLKLNSIVYVLLLISSFLFIFTRKHNFKLMNHIKTIVEFKKMLDNKDKQILTELAIKNPMYFYKALPYVLALNKEDEFIKVFERYTFSSPSWYVRNEHSNKNLNAHNIDKFISEFNEFFRVISANL